MSFDTSILQYIEDDEWRVLTAIEMGMRNHELVATELVHTIAGLRGSIKHFLDNLVRNRLIIHQGKPYDSYALTHAGYDFLALHALVKKNVISSFGTLIGQGKEADVYTCFTDDEQPVVVKFHRIGRVSFRKAKETRDYLNNKHTSSWLYLSRLSAQREFKNLQALQQFPVPRAITSNRHCLVMSLVPGTLLNNIQELRDPAQVFENCMDLAVSLLKVGVVHADFSQFNIMINDDEQVTIIDFPQTMKHTNPEAQEKFDHDVEELRRFFSVRFNLNVTKVPKFEEFLEEIQPINLDGNTSNDEEEEEETVDEEAKIRHKVSKENRYKRKAVRRNPSKPLSMLKLEAKNSFYQ